MRVQTELANTAQILSKSGSVVWKDTAKIVRIHLVTGCEVHSDPVPKEWMRRRLKGQDCEVQTELLKTTQIMGLKSGCVVV